MDYNINCYEILGLDKNATESDIKSQFKKLSKIYHPDVKSTGNENKFKEINNAYSTLSDPKSKQEYDMRSPHGNSYSPLNSFSGPGFEFHFGGGGRDDIFSQFFGGNSPFGFNPFEGFNPFQKEEFKENLDINISTIINLKQIYLNEDLKVKFKRFVHCEDCKGTGFDKQGHSDGCDVCNGTGKYHGGPCKYCNGDGKIYTGQCKTCKGEKVILKDTEVTLQNISKLRNNVKNAHRGYGHQSKYYKEKVGNLILNINIDKNNEYQVNGDSLNKILNVHFQDAIDGAEILHSHIDDTKIKIKLPTKTKNDDIIRVKEKGLLKNDNSRDDLYLKINIIIDYERI